MAPYLSIQSSTIQKIKEYCYNQLPSEGYGFLAGTNQVITHFFPIEHVNQGTCTFEFDPSAYLHNIKKMRDLKLDWLGIVHSHPHQPAYPSSRDQRYWHLPEKSCWIITFKSKEDFQLSAYYIKNHEVIPIIYEII
jgi:proteasome lid subunit RPN8/RPN11